MWIYSTELAGDSVPIEEKSKGKYQCLLPRGSSIVEDKPIEERVRGKIRIKTVGGLVYHCRLSTLRAAVLEARSREM